MWKPHPVGIAWYAREDYEQLLDLMLDADLMPDTFDEWLERAVEVEDRLRARGFRLLHVALRPEAFSTWCRENAMAPSAEARCLFAADAAEREEIENPPIEVDLRTA